MHLSDALSHEEKYFCKHFYAISPFYLPRALFSLILERVPDDKDTRVSDVRKARLQRE